MIFRHLKAFGLLSLIFCQSFFAHSQCPVSTGTEFITNGTFESAGGFGSDYTLVAGSPPSIGGGQYGIWTNPNNSNSYFSAIGDHTSGSGRMLIVDADGTLGKDAYNTTVTVAPNTTYFFSAWFSNINTNTSCGSCGNPGYVRPASCPTCAPTGTKFEQSPKLRFSINNVQVGKTVFVDSVSHAWNQFFISWNSGAISGPITIRIENMVSSTLGNDLALDDISFSNSCAPISNIDSYGRRTGLIDTVKACNVGFPYTLDTKLTTSNYTFRWLDNSGVTIPSQTNPTYGIPSTPGRYVVCYDSTADGLTGCWKKDTVIVVNTPLSINLGPDQTICSPFSSVLDAGLQNPPVTIQWSRNGTPILGATAGTYTATATGTYRVDASRAGCGSAFDQVVIANPVSSFSGTGTYCNTNNTASFSVTGATQVKWFTTATGGTALNPSNTNPTISTTYAATNTTSSGCASGLYAEDVGSYPGTLMSSQPCSGTRSFSYNENYTMIQVSQTATINSYSFFQGTNSSPGQFNFTIYNNSAGVPGSALFPTEVTTNYPIVATSTQRNVTLTTPRTLTPGTYWIGIIRANGASAPVDAFECNPPLNGSNQWTTPIVDGTGNNILTALKSYKNSGFQTTSGFFNLGFQVGSNNACSRLFVCASQNCPAPVEFYSFDATVNGNLVNLIWKTASEKDNKGFEVEKSNDGINYFTIAYITGNGSIAALSQYQYTDKNATTGLNYYRLKQIDFDGAISYSKTVSALIENTSLQIESIYPVPLRGNESLKVNINAPLDETITVSLTDMFGKVLLTNNKIISIGKNTVTVELDNLAKGIYLVSILHAQGKDIRTIIVE